MDDATIAIWLGRARIGLGIVALLAPRLATRLMSARRSAEGVEPMFARMIAGRDIAIGLGVVLAIDKGAPVRGWLEGAALADTGDLLSGLVARKQLTTPALAGTVAFSAGSALASSLLARRLDPAPAAHPGQPEAVVTGHHE
jgi:hypothetical protein